MENFSTSHINDLIGKSGKMYTADKFIRYPFTSKFSIENCICVCFSIIKNELYNGEIVCFKIDYFDDFTDKSYDENSLNINGFSCNGVLIIHPKELNYQEIIQDLENNTTYFKKSYADCLISDEENNKSGI